MQNTKSSYIKIFILSVPFELQPPAPATQFIYPQHNKKDYGIEQDFFKYLEQNSELVTDQPDIADWHYLPVYWTRYYLRYRRKETKMGQAFLQQQVSERILNREKTFTICQYDDGPLIDLGETVQFLASRKKKGIDVPLMSYPHEIFYPRPEKGWLASFVGRLQTHPTARYEMQRVLRGINNINIQDGRLGTDFFVKQMLQSYIALCPRGYGSTSFRFYEAMQLGIVPLLISNVDTRPFKAFIDWNRISLYAQSAKEIKETLSSHTLEELLQMGKFAQTVWYQDLAFGNWCRYVLKELEVLE